MAKRKTRSDGEYNRLTVRTIIVEKLNKNKRKPTNKEIAEQCGLSYRTVQKAISQIKFGKVLPNYVILTKDVLLSSSARNVTLHRISGL